MIWLVRDRDGVILSWHNNEAIASIRCTEAGYGARTEALDDRRYWVAWDDDAGYYIIDAVSGEYGGEQAEEGQGRDG